MIKYLFLISLLFCSSTYADSPVKTEFKGNIDLQTKGLKNSKQAKDLGQDWDNEVVNLAYANINGKIHFRKSTLKLNWFLRHSESELYKKNYLATRYAVYPNNVILRNAFKLRSTDNSDRSKTESVLNQFEYNWGDDEAEFSVGRMFIEYGEGYTFNPIDPFMLPLAFSTLRNVRQGNDGLKFFINSATDFRLHFYILGDKQFTDYDGKITRTVMLRGDWDVNDQVHVNYILGEDQKRHKYGAEVRYSFIGGLLFAQAVRNSQRLDKEDASDNGLFHYVLGYEKELTSNLTSRLEVGKYDQDNKFTEANYQQNFLPLSSFIAFINNFKLSDSNTLLLNAAVDPESQFSYFHADLSHRFNKSLQFHVFGSGPMSRTKKNDKFAAQQIFAGEIGLGVRGIF